MDIKIMPLAKKQTSNLLAYLLSEFGIKVRDDFKIELIEYLETISSQPFAFPILKKDIHRAVITKQTTIIYRVNSEKNRIEIVSLFDTRQDPQKLRNNTL